MEATIEQKLRALFLLQKIDSKIDEIRTLRGELPMEVADLEDEIAGLNTRYQKHLSDLAEYETIIADKKALIKDSTALKIKYEAQLNTVKNSREYDAITKEVEFQGLEAQGAEKKIKEIAFQMELKKEEIAKIKEIIDTRGKDLESKKSELDAIVAETKKEETTLQTSSEKAALHIEPRLLVAYKRIRKGAKNGLGVVTITRDSCGGCFNKIPPQRQADIRSRKKIIVCEHCGRILVDDRIESDLMEA